MVPGTYISPGYAKAIRTFQRLDKKDGAKDGTVDLDGKNAKRAAKYHLADINGDRNITLGEFLLHQLVRNDSEIREVVDEIKQAAKKAKWSTQETNSLLQMVFSTAGKHTYQALVELNRFTTPEVLTELKILVLKDRHGEQQSLLGMMDRASSPAQTKLNRLLSVVQTLWACLDYFDNTADVTSSFEDVRNVLILAVAKIPLNSKEGRSLFATLCLNLCEELTSQGPSKWLKAINSLALSKEQDHFLSSAIAHNKIKKAEDLIKWHDQTSTLDTKQSEAFQGFMWILEPANISEFAAFFASLAFWESSILKDLVKTGTISSLQEAKEFGQNLVKPDNENLVPHIDFSWEGAPARERAAYVQVTIILQNGKDVANKVIDFIATTNQDDVGRQEGYAADPGTIQQTLNWERVFHFVTNSKIGLKLETQIAEQLEQEAMALPKNASAEQLRTFFKKVPTQYVADYLSHSEQCGEKFRHWLKIHWKKVRPFLGHIFLRDAKSTHYLRLRDTLARQGLQMERKTSRQSFQGPIHIVNLHSMEEDTFATSYVILGKNQVLVTIDSGYTKHAAIINPAVPSTFKNFIRAIDDDLFPEDNSDYQYRVFYFPKIEFVSDNEYTVSMNYEAKEGIPEQLIGHSSQKASKEAPKEAQSKAYETFATTFQSEDDFRNESMAFWHGRFSTQLRANMISEPQLEIDDLFRLIRVMDSSGAKKTTCQVFNISENEYELYKSGIMDLLGSARNLTQQEFLAEAIKLCDGRVMLASCLSYNTLWDLRVSFVTKFPRAFDLPTEVKDPVGAIYHFFGTFFAAYAVQRCLVQRYHHDPSFRKKIDTTVDNLKAKMEIDFDKADITGLSREELLLFIQYRYVQLGGESCPEIITLTGIFKEEVVEDGDASAEVVFDMQGMSSGHALFEEVYDADLTEAGAWFSNNDNRRELLVKLLGKFAGARVEFSVGDKFAFAKIFDVSIREALSH